MTIDGLESFDVGQVKRALGGDVQVVLAAHPRAPLSGLAPVIQQRLREGLLAAGRAEAEISVEVNHDRLCMQAVVREGPVYECDEIRVTEAGDFPVPALIRRLTERYPPREAVRAKFLAGDDQQIIAWLDRDGKPVDLKPAPWKPGKPAPLASGSKKALEREVRLAFEDLGYHQVDFQLDVEAERATHSADLVIRLSDAGPPSVVEEIEITGNTTSSRVAIIQYLDLRPGSRLGRRELTAIDHALWRSGRFVRQDIATEAYGGGRCKLRIEVVESPFAPAIGQPLSREQTSLLKAARWLADPQAWHGDLLLKATPGNSQAELVVSPQRGMLVSIHSPSAASPRGVTLMGGPGVVGFYPAGLEAKFEAAPPDIRFSFQLQLLLKPEQDDPDKPFLLTVNAGFHEGPKYDDQPLLQARVSVEPSAAVAMATARGAQITWNGDIMSLTNDVERLEIDAQTGRLLYFHDRSNPDSMHIEFLEGAFQRRCEQLSRTTADRPNAFVPERPISSLLGFLTREDVLRDLLRQISEHITSSKWKEADTDRLRLLHRLVELGSLEPLDELMVSDDNEPEKKLKIPSNLKPPNWQAGLALAAVPLADQLFARGSWLWTVWRESALTVAGQGVYTGRELEALFYSDDAGPVCHLVVASLLERVKPEASHAFATRGMWLREPTDFRKDVLPLLDEHSVVGKCLRRAAGILAAMEREELAQLTCGLPEPWPNCLETLRTELGRRDHEAIDLALPAALESSWDHGARELVITAFRDLRDRTASR